MGMLGFDLGKHCIRFEPTRCATQLPGTTSCPTKYDPTDFVHHKSTKT